MNKIEKIKADIDRLQETTMDENRNFLSSYHEGIFDGLSMIDNFIDSLEEPVSNDLEEAAHLYVDTTIECFDSEGNPCCYTAFIAGAQWQKERILNNSIEREVKVDAGGYPYIDVTELYDYDKDRPITKWIDWLEKQGGNLLEKQGEQKPVFEMKTPEESLGIESDTYSKIVDECIYGEQKFKIEEGKWYVCTQTYVLRGKIVVIKGQTYQAEKDNVIKGEDGCLFIDRHDGKASDYFRSWTIQDAKDGDVLCDYHEAYDNPLIFILKKFEHVDFGLVRPSDYSSYCFLTASDRQRFKEGTYHHEHNIRPATKEQRNLLFQKMKETGYTFDFVKKELKKIDNVTLTAWSEEDKKMLGRIRSIVEKYAFSESAVDVNGELCEKEHIDVDNWLKSLKQMVVWKPSDEQMHYLNWIANIKLGDSVVEQEVSKRLNELLEQLKKLKGEEV